MKVRLAPRALADAKRLKRWWARHRTKAPDLFERELDQTLASIAAMPMDLGTSRQTPLPIPATEPRQISKKAAERALG